jgi:hypothetical protein
MTIAIILGILGLFYAENHEFLHKAKDQMEKGYEWKYVGYTEWSQEKSSSMLLNRDTNPHVYWVLTKPE